MNAWLITSLAGWPSGRASDLPHLFGQEYDDELGLYLVGARFYHPGLGRFISPDPLDLVNPTPAQGMPEGFNLYTYAANNPLRFVDPTGLSVGWTSLPASSGTSSRGDGHSLHQLPAP